MPRRPPRKPDPLLDLSGHLLELAALPALLDPQSLFSRQAPIEMEVGSGKGLFLSTAAAARPDLNFLGVEISGGYARLCGGKLAAQRAADLAARTNREAVKLLKAMLVTGAGLPTRSGQMLAYLGDAALVRSDAFKQGVSAWKKP